MILGPGIPHDQAQARIRAMDNGNTRFSLQLELAESVPAAIDAEGFALVVGDVHLALSGGAPPGPGGRLALDSSMRGLAEAGRVARFFQTQPQLRQRPPVLDATYMVYGFDSTTSMSTTRPLMEAGPMDRRRKPPRSAARKGACANKGAAMVDHTAAATRREMGRVSMGRIWRVSLLCARRRRFRCPASSFLPPAP